mmetsp:Transcript_28059/g.90349  ORF Transcript_28059/g.90349 Transcript_28059/m.90349 type:complete len:516 (+) Transcript_28059:380-1927(+)
MWVPPSGVNTPMGFDGNVCNSGAAPPGPTDAESARPGELLTSDSPRPTTTSMSASSLFAFVIGERVWMTKAYAAGCRGCARTASMRASSETPICFRLDTARSVHLEAHTPFIALCQGTSARSGAPTEVSCARTAASSLSGSSSSSTTKLRTFAQSSCSMSSSNSSRKSSFIGSFNTSSNIPKGTVALGGILYSPAFGVSSARWKLLPPMLLRFFTNSLMAKIMEGGGGGFGTTNLPLAAAALSASEAAAPSSFAGTDHVTSPLGLRDNLSLVPDKPCNSFKIASSSQLANKTFWLRARIATCESTSTAWAAGSNTATIPAGISSQPVSVSVTAMQGALPAGNSPGNAFIVSTVPMTLSAPALTSSQGPRPAPLRSCGCKLRKHCAINRSDKQRAVSSPKAARTLASGVKTAPGRAPASFRRSQQVCKSSAMVSATPAQTMLRRSQAESISLHHAALHRSWTPWSPSIILEKSSMPISNEGSRRDNLRSFNKVPMNLIKSSRAMVETSERSATRRN